jgi:hypothetical protein
MPPARTRNIDDSRSETSSSIVNLKEKSALGSLNGSGISKRAPTASNGQGAGKVVLDGNGLSAVPSANSAPDAQRDQGLPRVGWRKPALTPDLRAHR